MAQLLEHICIHYHMPPDEVMAKPKGARAMLFAIALRDIESGRTQKQNFQCPFMKSN